MASIADIALNAQCQATSDLLDGGYINCRTGTQPTNVTDTETGTLIATPVFNTPAFATPAGGSMDLDPPTPATAVDTGTITWGRIFTAADEPVRDVSISLSGGGGQLIADVVNLISGAQVAITFTWTIPGT